MKEYGYSLIDNFYDEGTDRIFEHYLDYMYPLDGMHHLGITETGGIPGDTVSVSVYADLGEDYAMHSFEVTVAGFGGGNISAVGVDTLGTIMELDWIWFYNIFFCDFNKLLYSSSSRIYYLLF